MTDRDTPTHTNRLASETSPYLQQHAHNPIDWYPWGDEALALARSTKRPIFLSVGYSACHWCHVMERESFEDAEVAAFLNEHFVAIKVDREERPDIDSIYMDAVQLMTGRGGWPMSVWLTPDLRPFYAGTYFPPTERWGQPGFMTVLRELQRVWTEQREDVEEVIEDVLDRMRVMARPQGKPTPLGRGALTQALGYFQRTFDGENGGFGERPKFPSSTQYDLLLHISADPRRDEAQRAAALELIEVSLARMAAGGMYDHLGGGFHRYSVDARWLIPHFEKMLYDNAQLAATFTETYQRTGVAGYARVVRGVLDYTLGELRDVEAVARGEDAAFWSTQDADSDGEEGKHFVWTPAELRDVLGEEDGERAAAWWGVRDGGNFEETGASALSRLDALDAHGHLHDLHTPEPPEVATWRAKLLARRATRPRPGTDTKVLTAWNGLMISALARAGAALDEPRYLAAAASAARFILTHMVEGALDDPASLLMRTFKDGRARFPGYLDDHSFLARAALDLFEATHDPQWLHTARALAERMIALFADTSLPPEDQGLLFTTAPHHRDLIVRKKDRHDSAVPSGNGVAVEVLSRLCVLLGDDTYRDRVEAAIEEVSPLLARNAHTMPVIAQVLDAHLRGYQEIIIVHPDDQPPTDLLRVVHTTYTPNRVLVVAPASQQHTLATTIPLLAGRTVRDDAPTAYVCVERACTQPTTDPDVLRAQLTT